MSGLEIILVYMSGIISGAIGMIALTLYIGKKALSKDRAAKKSVSERLQKVKTLTEEQLDMQATASEPQKNGLDGKYKNGLVKRVKALEEEKAEILKSILDDGFDPEVTVQAMGGGLEKMKLSEFLVQQGINFDIKNKTQKTIEPKKNPFTIIKGGKGDDGNGDGQTFH